jgi:hypothetical protein
MENVCEDVAHKLIQQDTLDNLQKVSVNFETSQPQPLTLTTSLKRSEVFPC